LENSYILLLWTGTLVIVVVASQTYRWTRQCRSSTLAEISLAGTAIAEVLFIINILFKIFTQVKFRDDLLSVLEEATFPMLMGSLIGASLLLREIKNLLPSSEKLNEQTEKLISRMQEKGISQEVIAYVAQVSIQQIPAYVSNNSSTSNPQIGSAEIDSTISSQIATELLPILTKEKDNI
jgi:hypothetical protein